ncbi:MAG TPA: glycosyltransferase, partial [Solirubrobacteraceae bacterium]|nr:glycosyltransferase [Solirubrobacteraceae bacterium]
IPTRRGSEFVARLPVNRHFGLDRVLAGAAIVHVAELHTWFSAQAARLCDGRGVRLVTTVWETLPFRDALRHPLTRPNRRRVLRATDLFLAATERARIGLLLEGVSSERIRVAEAGIDLDRFAAVIHAGAGEADPLVISPGRLVWEKGHQDVLRAVCALRRGIIDGSPAARRVRALILGSGPEEHRLRAYARDLGIAGAVTFRAAVPYDEMPAMYGQSTAMVLASIPTRSWEEQFGMVLVEAMAAGLPIVTTSSGAIPEVVGREAALVAAGDWVGIARALADGPLRAPGQRVIYERAALERLGVGAAAARIASAYDAVLDGASTPEPGVPLDLASA